MALVVPSPRIYRLSHPSLHTSRPSSESTTPSPFLLSRWSPLLSASLGSRLPSWLRSSNSRPSRASSANESDESSSSSSGLIDDELLSRVSVAKDVDQVLDAVFEAKGVAVSSRIETQDWNLIIGAALDRGNADLALSVFSAMRSGFCQGTGKMVTSVNNWTWAAPNLQTYMMLVKGLASTLRVSDAMKMIAYVSRAGVSSKDEVSFGMIVQCPNCMTAIAVSQPQHGVQVASCAKCRYQYELVSGDIVSIDSEEISMDVSAWEKAMRFLKMMKPSIPAAVHSIVIRTPSGAARTYRFSTNTVDLPAQEGERVTISLAAPSSVYRKIGLLRVSAKSPGFSPGEPMCITNHTSGIVSQLLRAPVKDGGSLLLNPSAVFPAVVLLTTGDFASGIIDPSLPRLISIVAVASLALGTTMNQVILPQLSKLPQRTVDVVAIKQQLLSQYDLLQTRIKDLRQAAENEVWTLARMCQLENKIIAVGEPSYRARRVRVKRVREDLESSLSANIELIESYAKISSMIEIEVEMDSDVLAAEAVSNTERIAEQIQQIMEIENLEERWRIQVEANDEAERLLSSQPMSTEHV